MVAKRTVPTFAHTCACVCSCPAWYACLLSSAWQLLSSLQASRQKGQLLLGLFALLLPQAELVAPFSLPSTLSCYGIYPSARLSIHPSFIHPLVFTEH